MCACVLAVENVHIRFGEAAVVEEAHELVHHNRYALCMLCRCSAQMGEKGVDKRPRSERRIRGKELQRPCAVQAASNDEERNCRQETHKSPSADESKKSVHSVRPHRQLKRTHKRAGLTYEEEPDGVRVFIKKYARAWCMYVWRG